MNASDYIVVLTTCADHAEAVRVATDLVAARLAGCVQMNAIHSVYRWQGKVESAEEVRLTIKAKLADYRAIELLIRARHSYDNPQILAIPIVAGSQAYFDWLDEAIH